MSEDGASTTSGEPDPVLNFPHHKPPFSYVSCTFLCFGLSPLPFIHSLDTLRRSWPALSSLITPLSTYFTHREDPSAVSLSQAELSHLRTGEMMQQE